MQLYRKGFRHGVKLALHQPQAQHEDDTSVSGSGATQVDETPDLKSVYDNLKKQLKICETKDIKYCMRGGKGTPSFGTNPDTPGPPKLMCTNNREPAVAQVQPQFGQTNEEQGSQADQS